MNFVTLTPSPNASAMTRHRGAEASQACFGGLTSTRLRRHLVPTSRMKKPASLTCLLQTGYGTGISWSGEGGIRAAAKLQLIANVQFAPQPVIWQRFAILLLLLAVCGCFGVFGTEISTLSAQNDLGDSNSPRSEQVLARPRSARRRRKHSSDDTTDDGDSNAAASYARYSSDQQREASIDDQHRKNRELAERNGHFIPPDLLYSDEAVSGTKRQRNDLDRFMRDAAAGMIAILYLHSLSRLARESVLTMAMLKQLVYRDGVRVICTSEGLDSDRSGWELIAAILSAIHERFVKELSANVFRGQEGTVLAGYAVGDHCFGYDTEIAPGQEQAAAGRNAKPRKIYKVHQEHAPWVHRIFEWFVHDRKSIAWIVRELNRLKAPKDHRATTPEWNHSRVISVLTNEKYIGVWSWGLMKNVRDPFSGNISQEPRSEEDTDKYTRQLDHLQIIDDETFQLAQERLMANAEAMAAYRDDKGRLNGSPNSSEQTNRRHMLYGLVRCGECRRKGHDVSFQVSGSGGKYMACPRYKRGMCGCRTTLLRERAGRILLDHIGREILDNEEWFECTFESLGNSWQELQQQSPDELALVTCQLQEVGAKIERLLDRVEDGVESGDIARRLKSRQQERTDLLRRKKQLDLESTQDDTPPTREWLRDQLKAMGEVLSEPSPVAAEALWNLLGGEVVVEEFVQPGRKQKALRGRFQISAPSFLAATKSSSSATVDQPRCSSAKEFVVDFVDPNPTDEQANQAKALYDQGLMCVDIATQMGLSKSRVTAVLRHWYEARGQEKPDGRSRRSTLDRKTQEPPKYQAISDEVKGLCDKGMLLSEIAERLDADRNTVTKAIVYWHRSRGLPTPDGRTRRKTLTRKSRSDKTSRRTL